MRLRLAREYNEDGNLFWAEDFPGLYLRGRTEAEALAKLEAETARYLRWRELPLDGSVRVEIVETKLSALLIFDADSDILLQTELLPLANPEYQSLKALALRSARDFQTEYASIPDRTHTTLPPRQTFYGPLPRTAEEMYEHTCRVNSYYFGEIGVSAPEGPNILRCREDGFRLLECTPEYLKNPVFAGHYGEAWTLRKVFRRFIWHDAIHAKAMFRMAGMLCGKSMLQNPFYFS